MPRKADILFLKLAVKNRILSEETARGVAETLERAERAGRPTKARYLCVERGLLDDRTAKQLKRHVKEYLEKKAEVSTSGKEIGSFKVEQKLGAGAMGIVYKARHVKLGRPVALKLLLPEFAQDDVYIERFEREARAAAQLNHPNIVQCFDAGQEDDLVFIAMEFVDGKTMKELIAEKGRIPEPDAVKLVIQVARALEHAAAHGLIHRDVKPANVMVTKDGTAKLLDMGLAKRIENQEASELTGVGHAIGTPFYMAPEQALDEQVDHRADIYALGATLFTAVVGEPPYRAPTPTGVLAKHLNEPVPSLRARVPSLSLGLDRVVQKMLAKKPERRYQKHATLIRDLEDVLAGLMPEVKDEAPTRGVVGITEGPRAAHQRTTFGTTNSGARRGVGRGTPQSSILSYGIGALAVAGALVVFLGTQKPSHTAQNGWKSGDDLKPAPGPSEDPKTPLTPEADRSPVPRRSPPVEETKEALETAARRQLDDIHRTSASGWELVAVLDNLARTRVGTKAAALAHDESSELAQKLDSAEVRDYEEKRLDLEKIASSGELAAAANAFRKLADSYKGEHAPSRARDRAAALEANASDLAARADAEADQLVKDGREDEAARILRASLRLRRDPQATEARARELERAFAARTDGSLRAAAAKDEAALRTLEIELRKDVRAHKVAAAQDAVRATLAELVGPDARERASLHASNLEQLASLEKLALPAFANAKGQLVSFERRSGTSIEGKIKGANETGVTVEISENAQATVPWSEIDEKLLVRQIRRAKGADEPVLVRLLALVKLYRGDDDAAAEVKKTNDPALAKLLTQVNASNGEGAVAKGDDPEKPPRPGNVSPSPSPPPGSTATNPVPQGRQERDQFIFDNMAKLFAGATDAFYSQVGPTGRYDFATPGRNFTGLWVLQSGEAIPTPAGRTERRGLILSSSEGSVVYDVPFTGKTTRLGIRFASYGSLSDDSRLSLVVTDLKKSDRYECRFGALAQYVGRGRKLARVAPVPYELAPKITTNADHSLEVLFRDGTLTARLDDEVTGELPGIGIAELKVGIEWARVNVSLLMVEVTGIPTQEYISKATAPKH
jgi:serine/threonine-protein kinase